MKKTLYIPVKVQIFEGKVDDDEPAKVLEEIRRKLASYKFSQESDGWKANKQGCRLSDIKSVDSFYDKKTAFSEQNKLFEEWINKEFKHIGFDLKRYLYRAWLASYKKNKQ